MSTQAIKSPEAFNKNYIDKYEPNSNSSYRSNLSGSSKNKYNFHFTNDMEFSLELDEKTALKLKQVLRKIQWYGTFGRNTNFYDAKPVTAYAAEFTINLIIHFVERGTITPDVTVTPDGGLSLSWDKKNISCEIDIESDSTIEYYFENELTGIVEENKFILYSYKAPLFWKKIIQFLEESFSCST